MNEELACTACGSRMIRGFIFDRGHYDSKEPSRFGLKANRRLPFGRA